MHAWSGKAAQESSSSFLSFFLSILSEMEPWDSISFGARLNRPLPQLRQDREYAQTTRNRSDLMHPFELSSSNMSCIVTSPWAVRTYY